MKKLTIMSLLIAALALAACSAPAATPSPEDFVGLPRAATGAPSYGVGGEEALDSSGRASAPVEQPAAQDRLVIKNAYLSVVVTDPVKRLNEITRLADTLGGFVVTSNVYQTTAAGSQEKVNQATITIRVPAAQFNAALEAVKAGAVEVPTENVTGQDVTQEYTDLQSRVRNLEAAEAQLREIMANATKTQDVLAVYNQLVQTQGELEVLKGQIQYYEQSAAFSSISADLIPDVAAQPIETDRWSPRAVFNQAAAALVGALQTLGSAAIWLGVYALPLVLLVALPLLVLLWAVRRRGRRMTAPKAGQPR